MAVLSSRAPAQERRSREPNQNRHATQAIVLESQNNSYICKLHVQKFY